MQLKTFVSKTLKTYFFHYEQKNLNNHCMHVKPLVFLLHNT